MMAFSSLARTLGEGLTINSPPALLFVFYVEISSRTLVQRFRPGSVNTGSARWDDCGQVFPDGLRVSSFPWHIPTLRLDSLVSPLRLLWVKGVCVFRCNLPTALSAEWPRSFTCHCGNTGVEWTPNKSKHRKWTLEKKILPPLLPGFELATFRVRVRRCTNKLSRLPKVTESYAKQDKFKEQIHIQKRGKIRSKQNQTPQKKTKKNKKKPRQFHPQKWVKFTHRKDSFYRQGRDSQKGNYLEVLRGLLLMRGRMVHRSLLLIRVGTVDRRFFVLI